MMDIRDQILDGFDVKVIMVFRDPVRRLWSSSFCNENHIFWEFENYKKGDVSVFRRDTKRGIESLANYDVIYNNHCAVWGKQNVFPAIMEKIWKDTSELSDYQYYTGALGDAQTPKQRQFLSIMRMKAMMDYPTKEAYAKGLMRNIGDQCIVFANTQAQADRMCNHSYHSKNTASEDNLQLFSDGRIDKLSCVLQLSEGVTIPNLKQGIIMHAYGNERKSAQRIGRLLRLNPSETATCHILCYKNTQDVKWVNSALSTFDQEKIKYYNPLNE